MENGLLAIRLLKLTTSTTSGLLEPLGSEDLKDIKKAWQLTKKLLNAVEVDSFRSVLQNYAD